MEQKSSFDVRTIVTIVICMGIWLVWQQHLEHKYPEAVGVSSPAKNPTASGQKALPQPSADSPQKEENFESATSHEPEKIWTYEDGDWKVGISSHGGRVSEIVLKKYTDKEGKSIVLVTPQEPGYALASLKGGVSFVNTNFVTTASTQDSLELEATQNGTKIKKSFKVIPGKYLIKTSINVTGSLDNVEAVDLQISQPAPKEGQGSTGSFLNRSAGQEIQEYFFNHGSKTNRHANTAKDAVEKNYDQTHFASLGSRYFTSLLFNRSNVLPNGEATRKNNYSILDFSYPVLDRSVPQNLNFDLYAGPKVLSQLSQVDELAGQVVDFGFFSWIALPLLELMKFFFHIFNNYGVAIIALTLLVRILTFPFTYVSYKSMKAMQKIQPEIQRLKEIYKDNTQALNQEMMKLMKENKVNPAGGCLPLLLQLPIFWALYQVLQNSIELYHSPFVGWIKDLSMKDPYYVLPVLMGLSMLVQQKMTPNTMDPAQAKVMLFMPLFFAFLMMSLPSGLTLYIFVSTLFGIIQQYWMMQDRKGAQPVLVRRT